MRCPLFSLLLALLVAGDGFTQTVPCVSTLGELRATPVFELDGIMVRLAVSTNRAALGGSFTAYCLASYSAAIPPAWQPMPAAGVLGDLRLGWLPASSALHITVSHRPVGSVTGRTDVLFARTLAMGATGIQQLVFLDVKKHPVTTATLVGLPQRLAAWRPLIVDDGGTPVAVPGDVVPALSGYSGTNVTCCDDSMRLPTAETAVVSNSVVLAATTNSLSIQFPRPLWCGGEGHIVLRCWVDEQPILWSAPTPQSKGWGFMSSSLVTNLVCDVRWERVLGVELRRGAVVTVQALYTASGWIEATPRVTPESSNLWAPDFLLSNPVSFVWR